jgi:hypothetical protein
VHVASASVHDSNLDSNDALFRIASAVEVHNLLILYHWLLENFMYM